MQFIWQLTHFPNRDLLSASPAAALAERRKLRRFMIPSSKYEEAKRKLRQLLKNPAPAPARLLLENLTEQRPRQMEFCPCLRFQSAATSVSMSSKVL